MDLPRCLCLAITFVAVSAICGAAGAQRSPDSGAERYAAPRSAQTLIDSSTVLKAARGAQATFERIRRRYAPRSLGGPRPSRVERIGRYDHWDDEDTSEYNIPKPPPVESPRVVAARRVLLARLDTAVTRLPANDWLVGHTVRYLIEAGDLDAAEQRARDCEATSWWCAALLGLVHHAAWRFAPADSTFAAALALMPEPERCAWTDLSALLADSVRERYEKVSCANRGSVNQRIWWLADPLHLRPGNDRRTEHYARMTMDRLQDRAQSGYGHVWRDNDLGELLRRYGWPSYFAQTPPSPGRMEPPGITAYNRAPSYHFLIDGDPLDPLETLDEQRWTLRPMSPRERYAPAYGTFATLRQLTSTFRRGDSLLVISAYDVRDDTLMPAGPLTAALILSDSPDAPTTQDVRHDAPARGTLAAMAADASALAAIEIIGGNRVRRARVPVVGTGRTVGSIGISDLGFFTPGDSLPGSTDAFRELARASHRVRRGERLGLFWELYGLRPSDKELRLQIQVVREGRGWLRRAGERIGLVGRQGSLGFGWRDAARDDSTVAARSIIVDLHGLDTGAYRIELRLMRGTDAPVMTSRRLEIVR
jgi:hypothetical protein